MKPHTPISALAAQDRPRERLLALGPRRLRSEELLAIIIGSGTRRASSLELARLILKTSSGPAGLPKATMKALLELEGIGPAVAMRIVAGCELNRRATRGPAAASAARDPAGQGPGSGTPGGADTRSVTGAA